MSIISMITGNDTPVGEQWVDDRMEEAQQQERNTKREENKEDEEKEILLN